MQTIPSEGVAIAQFGATWCTPCKQIKPHVEALAKHMHIPFGYFDMEEHTKIAHEHNVRAMPTIIAFKNGKEVGRVAGASMKQIESLLYALR